MGVRAIAVLAAALAALAVAGPAAADGEAGLVIHWDDGTASTHCVAFEGDDIGGDELLSRAGYNINQFSGLVCGIGGVGCEHSGSFNSCSCECQTGDDDCTYWAFFQQRYGDQWRYSALGLFVSKAEDGDLHGWKWGPGGPASAPAPPATTFEAVCGHAPDAVSTLPPSATPAPVTSVPGAATTSPLATRTPTPLGAPPTVATAEGTPTPAGSNPTRTTATAMPSPTGTAVATLDGGEESMGAGLDWPLAGFLVVAGTLALGIAATMVTRWRRGR